MAAQGAGAVCDAGDWMRNVAAHHLAELSANHEAKARPCWRFQITAQAGDCPGGSGRSRQCRPIGRARGHFRVSSRSQRRSLLSSETVHEPRGVMERDCGGSA